MAADRVDANIIDYARWARREYWDTHQAAVLFSGLIPDNFFGSEAILTYDDEHDESGEGRKKTNYASDNPTIERWLRLITLAREEEDLPNAAEKLSPRRWLQWADSFGKNEVIPDKLRRAVEAVKVGSKRDKPIGSKERRSIAIVIRALARLANVNIEMRTKAADSIVVAAKEFRLSISQRNVENILLDVTQVLDQERK